MPYMDALNQYTLSLSQYTKDIYPKYPTDVITQSPYRNSHQRCSVRKRVLRNFAKFTGKHLCQSLFFNNKKALAQMFSCEFCEISKNPFFIKRLQETASDIS